LRKPRGQVFILDRSRLFIILSIFLLSFLSLSILLSFNCLDTQGLSFYTRTIRKEVLITSPLTKIGGLMGMNQSRRKFLKVGLTLPAAGLVSTTCLKAASQESPNVDYSKRNKLAKEKLISVLSPVVKRQELAPDEPPPGFPGPPGIFRFAPSSMKLAKRLDTLENKTLYLVDIGFGGGYNFMLEVQRWFAQHMPSVTTIPRRKPGHVFSDDNYDLWDEIKEKGDAVILGVAG
jgi:hypothetical protein